MKSSPEETVISTRYIEATPNHPMITEGGSRKIGEIKEGEFIWCYDKEADQMKRYFVFSKTEYAPGKQNVYNIEASEGETLIMNDVMVLQK
jgi:hypothetical protein